MRVYSANVFEKKNCAPSSAAALPPRSRSQHSRQPRSPSFASLSGETASSDPLLTPPPHTPLGAPAICSCARSPFAPLFSPRAKPVEELVWVLRRNDLFSLPAPARQHERLNQRETRRTDAASKVGASACRGAARRRGAGKGAADFFSAASHAALSNATAANALTPSTSRPPARRRPRPDRAAAGRPPPPRLHAAAQLHAPLSHSPPLAV